MNQQSKNEKIEMKKKKKGPGFLLPDKKISEMYERWMGWRGSSSTSSSCDESLSFYFFFYFLVFSDGRRLLEK